MAKYIISGTVITGVTIPDKRFGYKWPVMPEGITKIADSAFLNNKNLNGELRIPDSVVEIGDRAFEGCQGLYWVRFNDDGDFDSKSKLRSIGPRAFFGTMINDKGENFQRGDVPFYSEKYLSTNSRFLEAAVSLEYIGYQAFAGIYNNSFYAHNNWYGNVRKTPAILNPYTYLGKFLEYDSFGLEQDGDAFEIIYKSGFKYTGFGTCILALYHSGNRFIWNKEINQDAVLLKPPRSMPSSVVELITTYNTNRLSASDDIYGLLLCNNIGIDKLSYVGPNSGVQSLQTQIETNGYYWVLDLSEPEGNYRYKRNYYKQGFPDMQFVPNSRTTIGKNAVMNFPFTLAFNNIVWEFPIDYVGTKIPPFTFYRALGLEIINIPSSITTIGGGAFRGCKNLYNITFDINNSKLTTIANDAFKSCPKLREIKFPKSLVSLDLTEMLLVGDKINQSFTNLKINGGSGNYGLLDVNIKDDIYSLVITPYGLNYVVNDICTVNVPNFDTLSIKITEVGTAGRILKVEFNGDRPMIGIKLYFYPNTTLYYNSATPVNFITMNNAKSDAKYQLLDVRVYTVPVYDLTNTSVTGSNSGAYLRKHLPDDTLIFKNTVTAINNDAFKDANLLKGSLELPNSLLTIGSSSFKNCSSLTGELIIPLNVTTIGESAFENCTGFQQDELVIPPNEFNNGPKAFKGMTQLKVVRIPNGTGYNYAADAFPPGVTIINTSSDGKFEYMDSSKKLIRALVNKAGVFPTIPPSVTGIDAMAFMHNSVSGNITLNKELEDIAMSVFEGCDRISSLIIPSSSALRYIDNRSFYQSSITENIDLTNCSGLTTIGSEAFAYSRIKGLRIENNSSLLQIQYGAFSNCTTLVGEIKIPPNVTKIEYGAFFKSGITRFSFLEPKVTIIDKDTFNSCSSLRSFQSTSGIFISDTITRVDDRAFIDCRNLAGSLVFGLNITTIGESAFENCSKLTGILVIPSTVTSIGNRAFAGCTGFSKIIVPGGKIDIATDAFDGILKQKIQQNMGFIVTGTVITGLNPAIGVFPLIPPNITEIAENAFLNSTGLRGTVTIPKTLTAIGPAAFKGCTGITKLVIQTEIGSVRSSLVNIGPEAFSGCVNITGNVVIPKSVTIIFGRTFLNCTKAKFSYYSSNTETDPESFPPGTANELRGMIILNSDEVVDSVPPIVKLNKVTKPSVNVKRLNFANGQFLF